MAVVSNPLVNQLEYPAPQEEFFSAFEKRAHFLGEKAEDESSRNIVSGLPTTGQEAGAASNYHCLSLKIASRPLLDGVRGLVNPPIDHGRETMVIRPIACIKKNGPVEAIVSSYQDRRRTIE